MGNMVNHYNLTAENICVMPVSVSGSNSLELYKVMLNTVEFCKL